MKSRILSLMAVASALGASDALAVEKLNVTIAGIAHDQPIPEKFAYCVPDGQGKSKDGSNINPEISWSGAPAGTKSYVVLMVDPDVPTSFETANKEGKEISRRLPRTNFYHWILTDIPPSVTSIKEGQDSNKITPGGKPAGKTAYGIRGRNDYAKFYKGTFGGYDGPCPPWNDERRHRYNFVVYALDIDSLSIGSPAIGSEVEAAIAPHVLAKGTVVGTYTQNPQLIR